MAIQKGSATGILYVQRVKGAWQVGVHNGSAESTITSKTSPAILWHAGKKGSIDRNRIYFYKTVEEYERARQQGQGPAGVPKDRLYARIVTEPYKGVPIGFVRTGQNGTPNNGAFIKFVTKSGKAYNDVNVLIKDLKSKKISKAAFEGGTLTYRHYNIKKASGAGRYDLFLEQNVTITGLAGIRRLDQADAFFKF